MYQIFTTTELASILECSVKTARKTAKKAEKEGIETITKEVNGREVEAFKIPTSLLNELKYKVQNNKLKYSGLNELYQDDSETISEPDQEPSIINQDNTNGQNFVFQMMDKYREDIKSLSDTFRDEMMSKDRQVLFLEDSEGRTKREFNELTAKVKQLEKENQELKLQLEEERNKPFWKKVL